MTTNMKIVFSVLLAALVLGGPALGQDLDGTLKKIKTSGTFTIGYREAAPPFSFPGPDKRPVGYSIDICMHVASAIQKQLGIDNLKLNWVPVTPRTGSRWWPRARWILNAGRPRSPFRVKNRSTSVS